MNTNKADNGDSIPYGGMEPGSSNARAVRNIEGASVGEASKPAAAGDVSGSPATGEGAPTHIEHGSASAAPAKTTRARTPAKAAKASKKKAGK